MTLDEAVEWVMDLVPIAEEPEIPVDMLDRWIRQEAASVDADGNMPGDDDWTPTFAAHRLNAVVAKCFERKAGLSASRFTFSTDGQRFELGNVHTRYAAQAAEYRRRSASSSSI
jgi:hypothetical protein